uniref:Uncharacterized protein n=1 Tax=Rhipicephalus zambeziensis TaxID=60191 RepID=A0A224YGH1_9ACAR
MYQRVQDPCSFELKLFILAVPDTSHVVSEGDQPMESRRNRSMNLSCVTLFQPYMHVGLGKRIHSKTNGCIWGVFLPHNNSCLTCLRFLSGKLRVRNFPIKSAVS